MRAHSDNEDVEARGGVIRTMKEDEDDEGTQRRGRRSEQVE